MLFPNTLINTRFLVTRLLGRGGMGEVWLARDNELNRPVVIKTVTPELARSRPEHTPIFIDEARIGGSLIGHPNVVAIFDIVNNPASSELPLAIVMEYVEGVSCADWIAKARPNVDQETKYLLSMMIAFETCKALSYAHRNSILHRDIKPLNIFVSKYGITKVGDFGLARYAEAVTREHTVWNFRSPAYSAPEQWEDKKPTYRTDLYQLGCTLYHLLTGQLPFDATSVAALIQMHLTKDPLAPMQVNPLISKPISDVILACLSKDPTQRLDLWQVLDATAKEVQRTYNIKIEFDKSDVDLVNKIGAITDFNQSSMLADGNFEWGYADYNEALSEAFELILLGGVKVDLIPTGPTAASQEDPKSPP